MGRLSRGRSGRGRDATHSRDDAQHPGARLEALVAASADALVVLGPDLELQSPTLALERMLAYPPGTLAGARLLELVEPSGTQAVRVELDRLLADHGQTTTIDMTLRRADERLIGVEAVVADRRDDPRLKGLVVNLRDISDRQRLEAHIEHQAFHDHLTGLANRGLLEDRVRHAIARSQRTGSVVALVFGDLDDFKAVNDTLGHAAGDELLVAYAGRLRLHVRPSDTLARVGGDEFAILMEDLGGEDEAVAAADRILYGLRSPFLLDGEEYYARSSLGVAFVDPDGPANLTDRAGQLLRDADIAMYAAKRAGHGQLQVFAPEMHEAASRRLRMKCDLQHALERGEFAVHYQPIVDLESGDPVGFEALARWEHPERGQVPPAEFVPVAEQSGLIVDVGGFVLREACRTVASWGDVGYVSVNVTGRQLLRSDFVADVASALHDADLEPHRLLLEVTETALIADTEASFRRLQTLRTLGVKLAIDDFGTGYSSLSYLRRFPMDLLKIDKSFVDGVVRGGRDTALVEAMVQMGRRLDLKIVAEGIEDAEQRDALAGLDCVLGQGYLFARPLPADEVRAWLDERQPGRLQRGTRSGVRLGS